MDAEVSKLLDYFREIVVVDTEFRATGHGSQEVRCVCGRELRSGKVHRLWVDGPTTCPYPLDSQCLFVAHYSSAELLSHQALGWPYPENVLDSCIEFHAATCGRRRRDQKRGLVDMLIYLNLPHLAQEAKDELRDLIMTDKRNCEFTAAERKAILDYCMSDVEGVITALPTLEAYLCQ